jgi:hypothetical protein
MTQIAGRDSVGDDYRSQLLPIAHRRNSARGPPSGRFERPQAVLLAVLVAENRSSAPALFQESSNSDGSMRGWSPDGGGERHGEPNGCDKMVAQRRSGDPMAGHAPRCEPQAPSRDQAALGPNNVFRFRRAFRCRFESGQRRESLTEYRKRAASRAEGVVKRQLEPDQRDRPDNDEQLDDLVAADEAPDRATRARRPGTSPAE